jgi:hypothetical protein
MKKLLILAIISTCCTCCNNEVPDSKLAAAFVENYMTVINKANYTALSEYYSEEMNNGETDVERIEKLTRLHDALGDMKEFKLVDSSIRMAQDEDPAVVLVYNVIHARMKVTETFTVKKQNGKLRIAAQNIENSH